MEIEKHIGIKKIDLSTWHRINEYLDQFSVPAGLVSDALRLRLNPDAFSKGQLASKFWLTDAAKAHSVLHEKRICVCGGWYAILSALLLHLFDLESIVSVDIDPLCEDIANELLGRYDQFSARTIDMNNVDYTQFDVVINTSFEHIEPGPWVEQLSNFQGIVIVQSNNYTEVPGHINCVNSVEELEAQLPIHRVIYKGTMAMPNYERYMIIGVKE